MEFEEMQIIWNSQDNEKLYAINEDALHAQIKRRSQSIERKLSMLEGIMIAVNFIAALVLLLDALGESNQAFQLAFSLIYLGYSVYAVVRRLARRSVVVRFDETILGELDKAIWQVDYLIRQGRSMILWYVLPLFLIFSISAFFNQKLVWAAGLLFVVLPVTFLASRWEINRFLLPKKLGLESLREKLVANSSE